MSNYFFILLMKISLIRAEEKYLELPATLHFPGYLKAQDEISIEGTFPLEYGFTVSISDKPGECGTEGVNCLFQLQFYKSKLPSTRSYFTMRTTIGSDISPRLDSGTDILEGLTTLKMQLMIGRIRVYKNREEIGVHYLSLPLSMGYQLTIREEESDTNRRVFHTMGIKRGAPAKLIYYPRFRDINRMSDDLKVIQNKTKYCKGLREGRKIYIVYNEVEEDCNYLPSPPDDSSQITYFELLPPSFPKCPCEYWHNPDDFVILRHFNNHIFRKNKTTTMFFDSWSTSFDLLIKVDPIFSLEFYTGPKTKKNCARLGEKASFVISSTNSTMVGDVVLLSSNATTIRIHSERMNMLFFGVFGMEKSKADHQHRDFYTVMRANGAQSAVYKLNKL